jgi:hypothetical protein
MKFNLPEILPLENNRYFYTVEKSMYGGYVIYLELESDLKASGTLLDETTKHHWKPLPPLNLDSNQLELKFYD